MGGLADAPSTRADAAVELLRGQEIVDAYRWLEGDNRDPERMGQLTPEVAAWTDAQNAHTRTLLDALPGRAALEERLVPLLEAGSVSAPAVAAGRYFHARRAGQQPQPVWYWREGPHGEDRVLIDPALLDDSGLTTVSWATPSPDGRLVAWGSYVAGDGNTTLRLRVVDSGEDLALTIPNRVSAVTWLPDASGFVYSHRRVADDPYSGRVMFHRLGSDPADDAVLMRQFTAEEHPELATTWGPFGTLSADGGWLVLGYFTGTRGNDLWVADFAHYLVSGELALREVAIGEDGWAFGYPAGDRLFLHTVDGSPNGRVDVVDLATGERSVLVPERADAALEDPLDVGAVWVGGNRLAVNYVRGGVSEIAVFDLDGTPLGELRLPGPGTVRLAIRPGATEAFVSFQSFNLPQTVLRADLATPGSLPETWAAPDLPVDPAAIEVHQHWYESRDGTRVGLFVAHRRGLELDGERPTILSGYGGFGVSVTPYFDEALIPWFEDGGVYAVAQVRGGGELGAAWHEAGMLRNKQNVFDDFIAAAEWLQANGYTRPDRLAIRGGSNGGLLTGAVAVQRPDLIGAALVLVPLLDMLRYQEFLMGRYWIPEYGSAEDPAMFPSLLAYSPYHNVREGVRYPAILLTAGENDTVTHPMHARKMAARLQAVARELEDARPVLLWVDREAGHGSGKPLAVRLRDAADQQGFLRWQLGMEPR